MHGLFRKKLSRRRDLLARCSFVTGDIAGPECEPRRLRALLPRRVEGSGLDAVISAFALHHLEHDEKALVYRRAHELLKPGGLFVNADLFTYQDPRLSDEALEFDLTWIRGSFLGGQADQLRRTAPVAARARLARKWLAHYQRDNRTEPVEDALKTQKRRPRTAGHATMLTRAGFTAVAVPFRFWQVGIVWARK